jgi:hypothetical protein
MDWNRLRRDKLAKAASDSAHQGQNRRRRVLVERMVDQWRRVWALSLWEKGILVAGGTLVVILAPVAVIALTGSSGDRQVALSRALPSATALAREVRPNSTAVPIVIEPTAISVVAEPTDIPGEVGSSPTPEPLPDRRDCAEIRGTAYRSSAEREWFLAHCLEPTLVDAGPPAEAPVAPSQPDTDPDGAPIPPPAPPESPDPSPPPSTLLSSAEVIALGIDFLSNEAPSGYSVSEGSCSASRTASLQWVVSCQAELEGCQGPAACQLTLSVCIIEEPLTVWSC